MCGRFAMMVASARMPELFAAAAEEDFPPRHNIAPTQPILTVLDDHGRRLSRLMRWGLVPGWVKDPREFPQLFNARAETIVEKPAFRDSLKHMRCIIPASGYFEWKAGTTPRQPYYIQRRDGEPMVFAGLYSIWTGPNGEEVDTVAIVTMAASPDLRPIHERMPAMLAPEDIDMWLNVREFGASEALGLLHAPEPGEIVFHPVSNRVNSAANDDADIIRPVTPTRPEPPQKAPPVEKSDPDQLDLF